MDSASLVRRHLDKTIQPPFKGPKQRRLRSWEYEFIDWFALQIGKPSSEEQIDKASELAEKSVGYTYILNLRKLKAFEDYYRDMLAGHMKRAKAKFSKDMPRYAEIHKEAMEMAFAAEDYKAVPAFTVPALDRFYPKREDVAAKTEISISLTTARQDMIDEEIPEVDFEVVEEEDDNSDTS